MENESLCACLPVTVFITKSICFSFIISTIFGLPSMTLFTVSAGIPLSLKNFAVPLVAMISIPKSMSFFAISAACGLSLSLTLMKNLPDKGIRLKLAICRSLSSYDFYT